MRKLIIALIIATTIFAVGGGSSPKSHFKSQSYYSSWDTLSSKIDTLVLFSCDTVVDTFSIGSITITTNAMIEQDGEVDIIIYRTYGGDYDTIAFVAVEASDDDGFTRGAKLDCEINQIYYDIGKEIALNDTIYCAVERRAETWKTKLSGEKVNLILGLKLNALIIAK